MPTEYGKKDGFYNCSCENNTAKTIEFTIDVYNKDKTLWENYSPVGLGKGNPSKPDFVGWTGLVPISIFFEYVLGILKGFLKKK